MQDAGIWGLTALLIGGIALWVWGLPKLIAAISKRVFYSSEAAEIKLFCDEKLTFETSATPEQIAESIRQHVTTDSGVPVLGADIKVSYTGHSVIFVCKTALKVFFSAGIAWEDLGDHRRIAWAIAQWREVNGRAMGLPLLRKLRQEVIAAMEALPGPNGEPHAVVGGLEAAAIAASVAGSPDAPLDPLSAEAGKRREKALGPLQWVAIGALVLGFVFLNFHATTLGWLSFGAAGAVFFLADRAGKMALKAQADPNAAPPYVAPPVPPAPAAPSTPPAASAPSAPPMPAALAVAPIAESTAASPDMTAVSPSGKRLNGPIVVAGAVILLLAAGLIGAVVSNRSAETAAVQNEPAPAAAPADSSSSDTAADSTTDASRKVPVVYAARVTRLQGEGGTLFDLPAEGQTRAIRATGISNTTEDGATVLEIQTAEPAESYALSTSEDWHYYIDGKLTNSALFASAVGTNRNLPISITLGSEDILNLNIATNGGSANAIAPAATHYVGLADLLSLAPADGSEREFDVTVDGFPFGTEDFGAIHFALMDGTQTMIFELPEGDMGSQTLVDGAPVDHAAFIDSLKESSAHMGKLTITRDGVKSFGITSAPEGGDI